MSHKGGAVSKLEDKRKRYAMKIALGSSKRFAVDAEAKVQAQAKDKPALPRTGVVPRWGKWRHYA